MQPSIIFLILVDVNVQSAISSSAIVEPPNRSERAFDKISAMSIVFMSLVGDVRGVPFVGGEVAICEVV